MSPHTPASCPLPESAHVLRVPQGLFGAGMISSFLKIVHILSVNPYLGPLQISLGRMIMDILRWVALYVLGKYK